MKKLCLPLSSLADTSWTENSVPRVFATYSSVRDTGIALFEEAKSSLFPTT